MSRKIYPSINGMPVPVGEILLPESHLDLNLKLNFNIHHDFWPHYIFYEHYLYKVLRNLKSHQHIIPIDSHKELHIIYERSAMPTPKQAFEEIRRAQQAGETIQYKFLGRIFQKKIGIAVMEKVIQNYLFLKNR